MLAKILQAVFVPLYLWSKDLCVYGRAQHLFYSKTMPVAEQLQVWQIWETITSSKPPGHSSLMLSTTYQKTNSMSNIKFPSTCCQCLSNIDFSKIPDAVDVFSHYNQLKKLWQSFCRETLSISLKLSLYMACRWGFQQWFSIPLDLWITKFLPVKTLILSYFPTRSCWVADRVHLTLQADTSPASVEETT